MTEEEMAGWHHRLSGHEFDQLRVIMKDREAWFAAVLALLTCGSLGRENHAEFSWQLNLVGN